MSLENIVTVNISLETSAVSVAAFGTPVFFGAHRWFTDRIRGYNSIKAAAADLPTDSEEYIAVGQAFNQTPAPSIVKVGRRDADVTITPTDVEDGAVYNITVTVNDADSVVASYIAGASDDEEDVVDGLKADIDADADVLAHITVTKTGTGSAATLDISATVEPMDVFAITGMSNNINVESVGTATAADMLVNTDLADSDWYFVTAHDKTEAFILAMAADIESRTKLYFTSVDEAGALTTLAQPATDIMGKLAEGNYFRTVAFHHHQANTKFPEMAACSVIAVSRAGALVLGNEQCNAVATSQDPATGYLLSYTQRNNLAARNANFWEDVGGLTIMREGKVSGGEWVDVIRNRDIVVARWTEARQNLMINSPVIPFTNSGISVVESTDRAVLNRFVTTESVPNVLEQDTPFELSYPDAGDVSFATKALRVLDTTGTLYLAGAIQVSKVTATMTYNNEG